MNKGIRIGRRFHNSSFIIQQVFPFLRTYFRGDLEKHLFTYNKPFGLEAGGELKGLELHYETLGQLSANKDNVIWICHALTANADVKTWWEGCVGEGKLFDPSKHFIICANILGSCYGSTGALSINPETNLPFYSTFPLVTMRDIVHGLDLLREHLGIQQIHTCIGGSLGGQQALEWAIINPSAIKNLVLMATNAIHSPWGISLNETQRMAIEADSTWKENKPDAGQKGLAAARAIALLSYRNYQTYKKSQTDAETDKIEGFKATTYQQYQGQKLVERFNVASYWTLTKALDSHNVGRNRGGVQKALRLIKSNTLIIGIKSDILFPLEEQVFMAEHIPNSFFVEFDSDYGHDGFLIEYEIITQFIQNFYKKVNPKELV